jgi:hypothetical protein
MADSLIYTSLEIGKALAVQKKMILRGTGNCMYPNIRPADLLHIQASTVAEINKGDLAVCRGNGKLVAPRVIAKTVINGTPCIITRADTNPHRPDKPVSDNDLLGIVSSIERKGKRLSPAFVHRNRWVLLLWRLRLAVRDSPRRLRSLICQLQQTSIYSAGAPFLLSILRPSDKWFFVVQIPFQGVQANALFSSCPAEEFRLNTPTWQNVLPVNWRLALHLRKGEQPAAIASFKRIQVNTLPDWQLTDIQVRQRYQGCGLQRAVTGQAEKFYRESSSSFC